MCVICIHIKLSADSANKVHFRGSMYSTKPLASTEVGFLEPWFAASGARKPQRELNLGQRPRHFFFGVSRLTSELVKYHQIDSVKIQHFGREN